MPFETILFEQNDEGVATITLNRPEKLNTFNQKMVEEMAAAWKIVAEDPSIKATVLRAAPCQAFCVGVDITDVITLYPEEPIRERDPGFFVGPKANNVWKPVVTAIHGMCAGGAFYFTNQTDIIICSEDAEFFEPHLSFGLVPGSEPVGLMNRMPYNEIMRMVLLGQRAHLRPDRPAHEPRDGSPPERQAVGPCSGVGDDHRSAGQHVHAGRRPGAVGIARHAVFHGSSKRLPLHAGRQSARMVGPVALQEGNTDDPLTARQHRCCLIS